MLALLCSVDAISYPGCVHNNIILACQTTQGLLRAYTGMLIINSSAIRLERPCPKVCAERSTRPFAHKRLGLLMSRGTLGRGYFGDVLVPYTTIYNTPGRNVHVFVCLSVTGGFVHNMIYLLGKLGGLDSNHKS